MKNILTSALRTSALAATLFALPALVPAKDHAPQDRAAQLLAATGSVTVASAGPYVQVGTFRVQVATALGKPTQVLDDGTWLYRNRGLEDSNAAGTLVVRFTQGRVSDLSFVTPAVAAAMGSPRKPADKALVAVRN